jgi:hypothetical protein
LLVTCRKNVREWVTGKVVPVTVSRKEYQPGTVADDAATVTLSVLPLRAGGELNVTVTPAGAPDELNPMYIGAAPVAPGMTGTAKDVVVVSPGVIASGLGVAIRSKLSGGAA